MVAGYGRTHTRLWQAVCGRAAREPRSRRSSDSPKSSCVFGTRLTGLRLEQPPTAYVRERSPARNRARDGDEAARPVARRTRGRHEPARDAEITELTARLRDEAGYTIVVIEHDMHVVEGVSDRVVALDHGTVIAEGSFEHVPRTPP